MTRRITARRIGHLSLCWRLRCSTCDGVHEITEVTYHPHDTRDPWCEHAAANTALTLGWQCLPKLRWTCGSCAVRLARRNDGDL